MEKDFKELLRLLQIKSFNEFFLFENGKLRNYHNLYVFKYKLRNFCEMVYSTSCLTNDFKIEEVISAFERLASEMVYELKDKQELLKYIAAHKGA
ncbi:hypothetical protein [Albibacterium sp.]|uniref:hypothetical protein n=1 Tax=Albibacterium sp. TaxID=2952885 RepID=UPI002BAB90C2|nr:hypothetical protein [Albibacterium sp.]HUH18832.1 hypothetical protein [Albibacterium sp.]